MTQNILKALSVCSKPADRTVPKPISDAEALLLKLGINGEVEIHDLITSLAAVDAAEWDTEFNRVAMEYARRNFIGDAQSKGLKKTLEKRRAQAIAESTEQVIKRLEPVFNQAVTDLTEAGQELPAGAAALDPEAILESETGSAYHQARTALDTITTITHAHAVRLRRDGSTPQGSQLVTVVAIPTHTETQLRHPLTQTHLNTEAVLETNTHVREAVKAYNTEPRLTLIDITRGRYGPDMTLHLADSPDQVEARLEHLGRAHMERRVREHETAKA